MVCRQFVISCVSPSPAATALFPFAPGLALRHQLKRGRATAPKALEGTADFRATADQVPADPVHDSLGHGLTGVCRTSGGPKHANGPWPWRRPGALNSPMLLERGEEPCRKHLLCGRGAHLKDSVPHPSRPCEVGSVGECVCSGQYFETFPIGGPSPMGLHGRYPSTVHWFGHNKATADCQLRRSPIWT